MVCDGVVSNTQVPTSWWNLAFPSSGLEGKKSCILKRGAAGSSKLLGLSTKPHGVTSRYFLNELWSPLHITCIGLIYMSTRVVELYIEFFERNAISFTSQNTW